VSLSTVTVHSGSDHAELAATAVKHAVDGRGVAHLVLPDEVQDLPSTAAPALPDGRRADLAMAPSQVTLDAALARLRAARRPVIIVGQGARGATHEITALAERLGAPVATTFRAKGLVPDTHPLGAGVLGRSGTPVASWLMNESDLLLVIGASFANHTGIASYKPIVQVDDAPSAIGRFNGVSVGVLGDAAVTTRALLNGLGSGRDGDDASDVAATDQRADVATRQAIWRAEKARRAVDDRGRGVASAAVFEALSQACPSNAVIAVDVGNHAYSFGRYFESAGQPVLMSGYLGSIGFGYPAAMGAWAATRGDHAIVAVTGDGGFGQYLAELTTAVKYRIPVKHVLLDNGSLGKISKEQLAGSYPVWQTSLVNPDFASYAEACGAVGISVRSTPELADGMKQLFAVDGPALLHIHTDAELV
jgi:thiamine pyrophosphate-dependent acetolactate synthase large subunit-like protein